MTRQMTGAKMVVEALRDQGVEVVFGYPRGAVLPIYDEIFQQKKKHDNPPQSSCGNEQGAVPRRRGLCSGPPAKAPASCSSPSRPRRHQCRHRLMVDALYDSIPLVVT